MPTNCRVAEKAVLNGSAQLWPIGPIGGHIGGISVASAPSCGRRRVRTSNPRLEFDCRARV